MHKLTVLSCVKFFDFKPSTLFLPFTDLLREATLLIPASLPAVSNLLPFDIVVLSLLKCQ